MVYLVIPASTKERMNTGVPFRNACTKMSDQNGLSPGIQLANIICSLFIRSSYALAAVKNSGENVSPVSSRHSR